MSNIIPRLAGVGLQQRDAAEVSPVRVAYIVGLPPKRRLQRILCKLYQLVQGFLFTSCDIQNCYLLGERGPSFISSRSSIFVVPAIWACGGSSDTVTRVKPKLHHPSRRRSSNKASLEFQRSLYLSMALWANISTEFKQIFKLAVVQRIKVVEMLCLCCIILVIAHALNFFLQACIAT